MNDQLTFVLIVAAWVIGFPAGMALAAWLVGDLR